MGLEFGAEIPWARQESFLVLVVGPDDCPEASGGSRGWLRLDGSGAKISGISRVGLGCWWRMANGGNGVRKFLLSWECSRTQARKQGIQAGAGPESGGKGGA